jgi:hypothetical protein
MCCKEVMLWLRRVTHRAVSTEAEVFHKPVCVGFVLDKVALVHFPLSTAVVCCKSVNINRNLSFVSQLNNHVSSHINSVTCVVG